MLIAIPSDMAWVRISAEAGHLMMFHIHNNIEFYNVVLLLKVSILQAVTNGN